MSNFFKTMFGSPSSMGPQQQMQRMMMQQQLGNLGAGLMQAGAPVPFGQSRAGMFGRAIQAGMPDPRQQMMMMQMQQQAAKQKQKQEFGQQLAGMMGGSGQVQAAGGATPNFQGMKQRALADGNYQALDAIMAMEKQAQGQGPKLPTGFRMGPQGEPEVIPAYESYQKSIMDEERAFDREQRTYNRETKLLEKKSELGKKPKLSDISSTRGQFLKQSNEFKIARDGYQRMQSVASSPTAAGDLALIFSFMKVLDPGSTVREGEFANAENSQGVSTRVRSLYNRVAKGERLHPDTRQDFMTQAGNMFSAQAKNQVRREELFGDIATRAGMEREDIVVDLFGEDLRKSLGKQRDAPSAPSPADMSDDDLMKGLFGG